jgi:hypothetical protein
VGTTPKKSDPAHREASRVSLGRGYLNVLVRWAETLRGVTVSSRFGSRRPEPDLEAQKEAKKEAKKQ